MRKIPEQITDGATKARLIQIQQEIDEKMKKVNLLKEKAKKGGFSGPDLQELKKMGSEIDGLDREWKDLVG